MGLEHRGSARRAHHTLGRRPGHRRGLSGALIAATIAAMSGVAVAAPAHADSGTIAVTTWPDLLSAFSAAGTTPITITLENTIPMTDDGGDLVVPSGADITLDLNGKSLTISHPDTFSAGIGVPSGTSLTVEDTSGTPGTLTVTGGTQGAGIGGGGSIGGGSVTINSGTINATGGGAGAGIGGGMDKDGGTVTINGGTVTATGGLSAAGIGGGFNGAGGTVTINGGTVTATGAGSNGITSGAGIGGGNFGAGAAVTIGAGAYVTATSAGPQADSIGRGGSSTSPSLGSLTNEGSLTIPAGAAETIPSGQGITNDGTITDIGQIVNNGAITGSGTISNPAQVSVHSYALSFDVAGSADTAPPTEYVYASTASRSGQSLPAGPTPPAGDPLFSGWFTASSGGTQVTDATDLSALYGAGPVTVPLYAQYHQTPQTITFDPIASPQQAGSTATLSATGGGSGNPVTFGIDRSTSPSDACSIDGTILHLDHVGTCVVDANQAGQGNTYTAAPQAQQSIEVDPVDTTNSVPSLSPVVFGQSITLTATITEADSSTPTGTVQFSVGGTDLGVPVKVVGGKATSGDLTGGGTLAPGEYKVGAVFAPTDPTVYNGAARAVPLVVSQAATSTAVKVAATTLSATVAPVAPGAGTPTGTVTFSVDGTSVGTADLTHGTASLDYTLPSGKTHAVSATYAGDTNFTGSSASASGQDPTITAKVTSAHAKHHAWYRTPVTVSFTCTPHGADLVGPCPGPVVLRANGAAHSVTRTIHATDGGIATVVASGINIDHTTPKVHLTGAKKGHTYTTSTPTPHCKATDSLSGIASCHLTRHTTHSHQGLEPATVHYTLTATDNAGNHTTLHGTYKQLGIYLQGARYHHGHFHITLGHTYTLVVNGVAQRPRYLDAAVAPTQPTKPDYRLHHTGHHTWAIGITFDHNMHHHTNWNIGVRIGHRTHTLHVRQ